MRFAVLLALSVLRIERNSLLSAAKSYPEPNTKSNAQYEE